MKIKLHEFLADPALAGSLFKAESFRPWHVVAKTLDGVSLEPEELDLFRRCTARQTPPTEPAREAWVVAGRRGGKSLFAAGAAVHRATCFEHNLGIGERGVVALIAADRKQSRVLLNYVRSMLDTPLLQKLVERETAEGIDLTNGISVEVLTCSSRSTRGYTIVCAVLDEVAFWRSEHTSDPDSEVLAAVRPATANVRQPLLLAISSPRGRRGILWDAYSKHHGKESQGIVCWQAASREMNPSLPQHVVDAAFADDPIAASAEFGGRFRADIEVYVRRETLDACTDHGRIESPPSPEVNYFAFCDPSGGSSDSMTLALAHRNGDDAIVDAIRERRAPFQPEGVVEEFAALLRAYGIDAVLGDRYAGQWVCESFRRHGIDYIPAAKPKSALYGDLLPRLNAGRIRLPDHAALRSQLLGLERRVSRGGAESIDHAPNAKDDVANALAGVASLVLPAGKRPLPVTVLRRDTECFPDGTPIEWVRNAGGEVIDWRPAESRRYVKIEEWIRLKR